MNGRRTSVERREGMQRWLLCCDGLLPPCRFVSRRARLTWTGLSKVWLVNSQRAIKVTLANIRRGMSPKSVSVCPRVHTCGAYFRHQGRIMRTKLSARSRTVARVQCATGPDSDRGGVRKMEGGYSSCIRGR